LQAAPEFARGRGGEGEGRAEEGDGIGEGRRTNGFVLFGGGVGKVDAPPVEDLGVDASVDKPAWDEDDAPDYPGLGGD